MDQANIEKMIKENRDKESTQSSCLLCGTCCSKGGPALHIADKHLVERGKIPSKYLFTIREGELAHDNINGGLVPVKSDIIKIKGTGDTWLCAFYDKESSECTIYDSRPSECRALKCWDTRQIEDMYNLDHLVREDLLGGVEGLWDLIGDHQTRCSYEKLGINCSKLKNEFDEDILKEINDVINYDNALRATLIEKGGMDPDMLEFMLGRPVVETIKMFGLKIEKKGEGYCLVS